MAAHEGLKESIVDIKARDQDGTWYSIEMQMLGQELPEKRAIYYAAKGYGRSTGSWATLSDAEHVNRHSLSGFRPFDDPKIVRQFVFKDMETNEHPESFKFSGCTSSNWVSSIRTGRKISTSGDRWAAWCRRKARISAETIYRIPFNQIRQLQKP